MARSSMSAEQLVESVGELVTLPDVVIEINRIMEQSDCSTDEIARVIGRDPALTVRVLRVANSPFYGRSARVDGIARAVTLLGVNPIRNLVVASAVVSSFDRLGNDLVSGENFWRHSTLCALAARRLAREARRCDPETLFTAGLLHDIGELVIFNRLPGAAQDVLKAIVASPEELPVYRAERDLLGLDHAQVGGELARQWQLPPLLQEAIACHHDIESARQFRREAALVHMANSVAILAELDTFELSQAPPVNPLAWEWTGLQPDVVAKTVTAIQSEIRDAESLFIDA